MPTPLSREEIKKLAASKQLSLEAESAAHNPQPCRIRDTEHSKSANRPDSGVRQPRMAGRVDRPHSWPAPVTCPQNHRTAQAAAPHHTMNVYKHMSDHYHACGNDWDQAKDLTAECARVYDSCPLAVDDLVAPRMSEEAYELEAARWESHGTSDGPCDCDSPDEPCPYAESL